MKYVWIILAALVLNGCNTLAGLGRDTKAGFFWTNDKIYDWQHSE
jgi:hypothetical protein